MNKLSLRSAVLTLTMGGLLAALPLAWAANVFDAAGSSLSAVFTQMGVPVEAKFKKFTAQIDYDPADPSAAKAQVDVDVASFDIGDPEYNKEVLKKEWFNAAQFPKATFISAAIKPLGSDKLQCAGQLTIKGKSMPVNVTLTVKQQGNSRIFEGSLPIKRLDFNIGEGEWKSTDMLADLVTIKFKAATTVK